MKIYLFKKSQKVPLSEERAWEFFSNPHNLKLITPPHLNFNLLYEVDKKMYEGQMICYTVCPLFSIPLTWVTEITQVKEPHYFVDEQRFGPYSLWHHEHHFFPIEKGVEMVDIIHYKLPLGPLGRVLHSLKVKRDLEEIFSYRKRKLEEMFGFYPLND